METKMTPEEQDNLRPRMVIDLRIVVNKGDNPVIEHKYPGAYWGTIEPHVEDNEEQTVDLETRLAVVKQEVEYLTELLKELQKAAPTN